MVISLENPAVYIPFRENEEENSSSKRTNLEEPEHDNVKNDRGEGQECILSKDINNETKSTIHRQYYHFDDDDDDDDYDGDDDTQHLFRKKSNWNNDDEISKKQRVRQLFQSIRCFFYRQRTLVDQKTMNDDTIISRNLSWNSTYKEEDDDEDDDEDEMNLMVQNYTTPHYSSIKNEENSSQCRNDCRPIQLSSDLMKKWENQSKNNNTAFPYKNSEDYRQLLLDAKMQKYLLDAI